MFQLLDSYMSKECRVKQWRPPVWSWQNFKTALSQRFYSRVSISLCLEHAILYCICCVNHLKPRICVNIFCEMTQFLHCDTSVPQLIRCGSIQYVQCTCCVSSIQYNVWTKSFMLKLTKWVIAGTRFKDWSRLGSHFHVIFSEITSCAFVYRFWKPCVFWSFIQVWKRETECLSTCPWSQSWFTPCWPVPG